MTTPATTTTTPPPDVRAVAFLITKGGLSVLDRHRHPEKPDKEFLAAPTHLSTALQVLRAGHFRIDSWNRVSVSFRGPAALFREHLGIAVSGAGGVRPRIAPAGSTEWATSSDVRTGSALFGHVARVVVVPPNAPEPGGNELFSREDPDVRSDDVIVGDTVSALMSTWPPRPTGFPPRNAVDALRINRGAQRWWSSRPFREWVEASVNSAEAGQDVVAALTGEPTITVDAVIVEQFFPPQIKNGFVALALADNEDGHEELIPDLHLAPRINADVSGRWYHDASERAWVDTFRPGGAVHAATAAHQAARTIPELAATLQTLLDVTADVPVGEVAAIIPLQAARATLTRGTSAVAAGTPAQAEDAWARLEAPRKLFDRWRRERWTYYDRVRGDALQAARRHGTMCALPLLSVVLNMVHISLEEQADPNDTIWTSDPPGDDTTRTVVSCSAGILAPDGLGAPDVVARLAARLPRLGTVSDRVLYVLPVGNTNAMPSHDVPDAQCALSGLPNVLIVGGAAERGGFWAANPNTHGYTATVPRDGGTVAVTVPDVCALTLLSGAGSVVYPDVPAAPRRGEDGARWWVGSGSSLSTPLVAAICALVWARHPGMSAADVKQAVIDGSVALPGGAFHVPAPAGGGLGAFPPADSSTGWRGPLRATLDGALDAADAHWPGRASITPPALRHSTAQESP